MVAATPVARMTMEHTGARRQDNANRTTTDPTISRIARNPRSLDTLLQAGPCNSNDNATDGLCVRAHQQGMTSGSKRAAFGLNGEVGEGMRLSAADMGGACECRLGMCF